MASTQEVRVGILGKAHGVKGEAYVDLRTDEPARRFKPGAIVYTRAGQELCVARSRKHSGRWLVSFVGFGDRTAVERLRGQELWARVEARELPQRGDEYFDRHLIGLRVVTAAGHQAGVVQEVQHHAAQDLLVVDVGGEERLVPFVEALVPVVNLDEGFIQLADVEGLVEDGSE